MKAHVPPTQKPPHQHRPNPEFNAGAAETRKRILSKLMRLRCSCDPLEDLEEVIIWVKGMSKRSAKRAGGQGRK